MFQRSADSHLAARSHHQLNHRAFLAFECAAFAVAVAVLLSILRKMLFSGQTTMTHDTVLWVYPVFTYLADGILHGHFPLWNPFSRAGEPLFFSYLQMRLFDPVDYLVIYIGSFFTSNLTTIFNWDRVIRLLVSALGVHLLLRRWARHPVTRMVLPFVAVLSSMTTNGFHQPGFSDQFYCSPFLAICVFRILEGRTGWANWLAAVFLLGQCLQSYYFVGPITFVLFIVVAYALFRRPELVRVLRDRQTWFKASVCVLFLIAMSAPSLIGVLQQKNYYTPARSIPPAWQKIRENTGTFQYDSGGAQVVNPKIAMPYAYIRLTGTPSRPAELLGLLAPNEMDLKEVRGYPMTAEARLFIGGLAFIISLAGIFLARHPFKRIWLLLLVGFGTLMLGPYTPVHWLLYLIYPPLWVIRHTEQFINYFLMALLFFFVLGSDLILTIRGRKQAQWPDLWVLYDVAGRTKHRIRGLIRDFARWLDRVMQTRSGRILFRWRYATYLSLTAICAVITYRYSESLAAYLARHLQVEQFPLVAYMLAVLATAAAIYVRRLSPPLSEAIDRSVFREWYRRLWALVASVIAIDVVVRLSSTGPGIPVEYMSWMPTVTTIATAVLVVAAIAYGDYFPVVLVFGMIVVMACLASTPSIFVLQVMFFILIPVAGYFWLRSHPARWNREVIAIGLVLVTALELSLHMVDVRAQYQVPRVEIQKNWPVTVGGLPFPKTRIAAISEAPTPPKNFQVVRYPELLARVGVALETPHDYPFKPYIADAEHILGQPRWNTIIMLNTYRELIFSGLPPKAIESIFAINASTFHFRSRAKVTGNFIGDLRALKGEELISTLADTIFLDSATLPPGWSAAGSVSAAAPAKAVVSVVSLNYDFVSVVVESDRAGFLYFVDGFTPDWRATINGAATHVFRADGNFKAVQIPAGRSTVDFAYRPRIVIWAICFYFGALLLAASMAAGFLLVECAGGLTRRNTKWPSPEMS